MRDSDREGIFYYKFIDFGSAINIWECKNFMENKENKGLTYELFNIGTKGYLDNEL
jgi:hypothetical protein